MTACQQWWRAAAAPQEAATCGTTPFFVETFSEGIAAYDQLETTGSWIAGTSDFGATIKRAGSS